MPTAGSYVYLNTEAYLHVKGSLSCQFASLGFLNDTGHVGYCAVGIIFIFANACTHPSWMKFGQFCLMQSYISFPLFVDLKIRT